MQNIYETIHLICHFISEYDEYNDDFIPEVANDVDSVVDVVKTISADKYARGRPQPGDHSNQKFESITDIDEDRSDILGRIEIDFFIFKTKESARKIFAART